MRFQNANVALETCCFRKVSPFLCGQFLIWTCAPNSSRSSCLEAGDRLPFIYLFHSMSLISGDVVLDDSEASWVSADLVADIDPVPPYCR